TAGGRRSPSRRWWASGTGWSARSSAATTHRSTSTPTTCTAGTGCTKRGCRWTTAPSCSGRRGSRDWTSGSAPPWCTTTAWPSAGSTASRTPTCGGGGGARAFWWASSEKRSGPPAPLTHDPAGRGTGSATSPLTSALSLSRPGLRRRRRRDQRSRGPCGPLSPHGPVAGSGEEGAHGAPACHFEDLRALPADLGVAFDGDGLAVDLVRQPGERGGDVLAEAERPAVREGAGEHGVHDGLLVSASGAEEGPPAG